VNVDNAGSEAQCSYCPMYCTSLPRRRVGKTWTVSWVQIVHLELNPSISPLAAAGNIRTCKYEFEDCIAKARPKEIVLGSVRHITDKCQFQPKNEHQFDLNQYPGYFAEGYIKELFPTDKDNKPVTRKLWSRRACTNPRTPNPELWNMRE
jgi:hypothetical protein